jgi:hypothetical protein
MDGVPKLEKKLQQQKKKLQQAAKDAEAARAKGIFFVFFKGNLNLDAFQPTFRFTPATEQTTKKRRSLQAFALGCFVMDHASRMQGKAT